ncbi:hypothetical protein BBBOND_0311140 [Babesia bigemina]|uniref:Uncharacterized protein n=1 Tax=Babesia bigemina TaxID=5866 RepID=A0A061D938_BABBI|nr:hypothetical protein BBBOND_0311140 [Babesia bigemina]CDR97211.1 hypothetical protein BBBOND_0311140 [Babesia bigemina]|eukprot:XP_012769397.1 hypothetical protein BBBOND_0311140 [Babesia bigemina]
MLGYEPLMEADEACCDKSAAVLRDEQWMVWLGDSDANTICEKRINQQHSRDVTDPASDGGHLAANVAPLGDHRCPSLRYLVNVRGLRGPGGEGEDGSL